MGGKKSEKLYKFFVKKEIWETAIGREKFSEGRSNIAEELVPKSTLTSQSECWFRDWKPGYTVREEREKWNGKEGVGEQKKSTEDVGIN